MNRVHPFRKPSVRLYSTRARDDDDEKRIFSSFSLSCEGSVSKNKTEFFLLTIFSSSFWSSKKKQKREQKKDTEENKISHFEKKRAKFGPKVVPKKERILPNKTSKKRRRESKHKNTKDLHHLKSRTRALSFSTLRSEYYCSYSSLILYSSKRDSREREYLQRALLILRFLKSQKRLKCISSL